MFGLKKVIVIGLIAAIAVGGFGAWYFLKDDAPAKVSLDNAEKSVTTVAGSTGTTGGSAEGTWKLNTSTGSFDFTSATGTFAGFRIKENLSSVGSTTAVGRTGDVDGGLTITGTKLTKADFTVNLTTLKTDRSMRDNRVQGALQTDQFPQATFTLTEPVELGDAAKTGAKVSVMAKGNLTVHGVTKPVTVKIDAKIANGTLLVVGSTDLALADYGIQKPTAPIVVSVDDNATLEFQLLLDRA